MVASVHAGGGAVGLVLGVHGEGRAEVGPGRGGGGGGDGDGGGGGLVVEDGGGRGDHEDGEAAAIAGRPALPLRLQVLQDVDPPPKQIPELRCFCNTSPSTSSLST